MPPGQTLGQEPRARSDLTITSDSQSKPSYRPSAVRAHELCTYLCLAGHSRVVCFCACCLHCTEARLTQRDKVFKIFTAVAGFHRELGGMEATAFGKDGAAETATAWK
eukprot:355623-Chlamydomonas_euryale.AAC.13